MMYTAAFLLEMVLCVHYFEYLQITNLAISVLFCPSDSSANPETILGGNSRKIVQMGANLVLCYVKAIIAGWLHTRWHVVHIGYQYLVNCT